MNSDTPKMDTSPENEVNDGAVAMSTPDNITPDTDNQINDVVGQSITDEKETEYEKECHSAVDAISSVLDHGAVNTDLTIISISESTDTLPTEGSGKNEALDISNSSEMETMGIVTISVINGTPNVCKSQDKEIPIKQPVDITDAVQTQQDSTCIMQVNVDGHCASIADASPEQSSEHNTETKPNTSKTESLDNTSFEDQSLTPETYPTETSSISNIPRPVTPDVVKEIVTTEDSQTSENTNDSLQVPNEDLTVNGTTFQPVYSYEVNGMDYMVQATAVTQPPVSMTQSFINPPPPNYFQHHNVQMDQSATGMNYQPDITQNQTAEVNDPYRSESTDSGKSETTQDQTATQNTNTTWNYFPQVTQNMNTEYAQYAQFAEYQKQYQLQGSTQDYNQAPMAEPARSQDDPMLPRVSDAEDIATYVAQQAYMANVSGTVASMIPVKFDGSQVMPDTAAVQGPSETRTSAMTSQPVRRKQKKVVVPADPMKWTVHHVKDWLDWSILEHSLHDVINTEKFPSINGRELCQMSRDGFVKLIGQYEAADKLLQHIEHLRESYAASIDGSSNETSSPTAHASAYMHTSGGACVTKTGRALENSMHVLMNVHTLGFELRNTFFV